MPPLGDYLEQQKQSQRGRMHECRFFIFAFGAELWVVHEAEVATEIYERGE